MAIGGVGPITSRVCILDGEAPSVAALAEQIPFHGWNLALLKKSLLRAGFDIDAVRIESLRDGRGLPSAERKQWMREHLNSMPLEMIIPLGSTALEFVTGKKSIDKWHLSPLAPLEGFKAPKCVPAYPITRINQDYALNVYLIKALERAASGLEYPGPWKRKPYRFHLNPSFDDTIDILRMLQEKPVLANDIETGSGIINTVGFAWSAEDAIAIQTLPERFGQDGKKFKLLWDHIAYLLEAPGIKKIFQNLTYEDMYYSRYGIKVQNHFHDTMWAMRLLWPEFNVGLDNVGRLYTNEPYWKDTGKDYKTEGGKRDWNNIKDWGQHLLYNCLDTSGTFEAHENQRADLKRRGLLEFFDGYLMKLAPAISEMCSRGLPINEATRAKLQEQTEGKVKELCSSLSQDINPKSPKQKMSLLKSKGYKLPKIRVKGKWQESTNELSLKKLRLKYPDDRDIQILLELTHLNKALGSYINFEYDSDSRLRFMLNGAGTETLRWSSSKDPWNRGLNAQTLPSKYKVLFDAPPGKLWFQVDLAQAESRFVAYDSCDENLMAMIEDPNKDVHKFVASHIFEKPESEIVKSERQLGKKSGHGANYSMAAQTFMESCLKEMDLVLTKDEAQRVLDIYHSLFPGIRRWHAEIRETLYNSRKLSNPLGFERYFYGRMDDNTFREAYAFKPQSTIPMITNHLMLGLMEQRSQGAVDFALHLQVHDSLVLLIDDSPDVLGPLVNYCHSLKLWHPEIRLSGGELWIPVETEIGQNLGKLQEIHPRDLQQGSMLSEKLS